MIIRGHEAPTEPAEPGVTRQVLGHDPELMMVRVTFTRRRRRLHPLASAPAGDLRRARPVPRSRSTAARPRWRPATAGSCRPTCPHGAVALEAGALIDVFTPARTDFLGRPALTPIARSRDRCQHPHLQSGDGIRGASPLLAVSVRSCWRLPARRRAAQDADADVRSAAGAQGPLKPELVGVHPRVFVTAAELAALRTAREDDAQGRVGSGRWPRCAR